MSVLSLSKLGLIALTILLIAQHLRAAPTPVTSSTEGASIIDQIEKEEKTQSAVDGKEKKKKDKEDKEYDGKRRRRPPPSDDYEESRDDIYVYCSRGRCRSSEDGPRRRYDDRPFTPREYDDLFALLRKTVQLGFLRLLSRMDDY